MLAKWPPRRVSTSLRQAHLIMPAQKFGKTSLTISRVIFGHLGVFFTR